MIVQNFIIVFCKILNIFADMTWLMAIETSILFSSMLVELAAALKYSLLVVQLPLNQFSLPH